jgi:histidinol-phosphate aminotransferase
MYEEYARDTATDFVAIARDSDFVLSADRVQGALTQHAPQVVFFASPNNPTGTALELHLVELALRLLPHSIIVVDEAYAEFRRAGTQSAINLLAKHPNLVVTRTMSKAFACAGLRVGYMAASAEIVNHVKLVRLPYHLSSVSQAIATVALQHAADLQKDLEIIRQERDGLVQWLSESGFQTAPSDANFVLFGTFSNRRAVWQALVDQGVLVREVGPDGWLRVTIGTPEEMAVFRTALLETRDASL